MGVTTRFPRFAAVCLPRADVELARRLLAAAPWLEVHGDLALLDPRGTERIHGDPAGLFAALRAALAPDRARGMALASQRLTAELAARHGARVGRRPAPAPEPESDPKSGRAPASAPPVREADDPARSDDPARDVALLIPAGDEALFLSRLPLAVLDVPPRLAKRWAPLGLETLGDLAALPAASVETRYGAEGLALHRLARGLDERGLCPEPSRDALRVEHACAHPVDRLPRLEPLLAEACARLAAALTQLGEGALELELALQLDTPARAADDDTQVREDTHARDDARTGDDALTYDATAAASTQSHTLRLPEAEARAALLLDLLCQRLTQQPPPRAVTGFALRVSRSGAQAVHQNALFGEVSRDASRRREALARAGELFGARAVQPLAARAAHLPEQRWVERPAETRARRAHDGPPRARPGDTRSALVLRHHEPPEELVPLLAGGRLVGFRLGRRELRIEQLSPPRRLEGGWWSAQPWARDEYELLTSQGELYRVGRDLRARRWLLLGELD